MLHLALALVAVVAACKNTEALPAPAPATPVVAPLGKGDTVAVAAPTGASHADWIKPAKVVAWTKPARAPNSQEALLYGTWAAKTGNYATRSAFMADRNMYALDGRQDLVGSITDAIAGDNKLASNCIWLELRPDFTGIRRECAVVNGEPSALDQNDVVTGKKSDLGTKLEWLIDEQDHNKLKIHFDADMVVPVVRHGKLQTLVFRMWVLQIGTKVEDNTFEVTETLPEHDVTLPTRYAYFIAPQRFLDSP